MARKRNHPLVAIVCWLGTALAVSLCALALVVSNLGAPPGPPDLDAVHLQGMAQGNAMCKER